MNNPSGRPFDRVLVIMFENQYRSYVLQNPYMARLAAQGIELVNSYGIYHPSQTNYISSVAGELCNVYTDDVIKPLLPQRTIFDLIEESPRGLRWGVYMQSYRKQAQPWTPDLAPADDYPYVIKHNPAASFERIVRDERRWARVGNESDFWKDVLHGDLPEFSWFTPNMWNDGHYLDGTQTSPHERAPALVDQLSKWLQGFFGALRFPGPRSHLPPGTLVVVTFDEADFESDWETTRKSAYDGPNQVYTVLLGDGLRPGKETEAVNHYSLLRTVQENFELGSLGKNDAGSNWFRFLWRERFAWGEPAATPLTGAVGAGAVGDVLVAVQRGADGALAFATHDGAWSALTAMGRSADAHACWSQGGLVWLATVSGGAVSCASWDPEGGWSDTLQALGEGTGELAASALADGSQAMLAWRDASGAVQSRVRSGDSWGEVTAVAAAGAGAFTVGALGASFYLVQVGADGVLGAISWNTADFNVMTEQPYSWGGPVDDATRDRWAPMVVPVALFTDGRSPVSPGEPEPVSRSVSGAGPLVASELDGVLRVACQGADGPVEVSLSLGGLLTPAQPFSFDRKSEDTSNGFGTLAEATWNEPVALDGAAVAVARRGRALVMFARSGDAVVAREGEYRSD